MPKAQLLRPPILQRALATLVIAAWVLLQSATAHALKLQGTFEQGGMVIGSTTPNATVALNGQIVPVSDKGVFVFGFGRDAEKTATLEVTDEQGNRQRRQFQITQRDYNIQRIEGVPQRTVTPPESALKRIRAETKLVKTARQRNDARQDFLEGFEWPLNGRITGVYGSQRVYNGVPKRPHYGIDIAAPAGTIVRAPASGIVTLVHQDMYYSGGTLILDHGQGISSTFLHLQGALVEEGQRVEKGQPIAEVGSSGRSTGAHLDWRINWFNTRLDPQFVAPPMDAK